jgi:DNA-binding IclR family transcriptional regulator
LDSNGAGRRNDDELKPAIAAVLEQLWEASREPAGKTWSLAKLSKRARIPMSALRRNLTQLEVQNFVDVEIHDDGTGSAALNVAGLELCGVLFGAR